MGIKHGFHLLWRGRYVVMMLSLIGTLLLSGFFSVGNALAQSVQQETAFRAAEAALSEIRDKIESQSEDGPISSLGGRCTSGLLKGKNVFGEYEVTFRTVSGRKLSCGSNISMVAFIEVRGFFQGASWTIGQKVHSRWQNQDVFRCTGNLPDNSEVYPGDDENLTESIPWEYASVNSSRKCEYVCEVGLKREYNACVRSLCLGAIPSNASRYDSEEEEGIADKIFWQYSPSDTDTKCEYRCNNGYLWRDHSCISTGNTKIQYVTTGIEDQEKEGAFGVQGAFKTYGGIDMEDAQIENVALPVNGSDIANKAYVDNAIQKAFGQ